MDEKDALLLEALQRNARLSNVELAKEIGLSAPATLVRAQRLEREGIIERYTAVLDKEKLGFDLLCFTEVSLQSHDEKQVESFHTTVRKWREVLECYNVTGDYDYLLKVALKNRQDLERFMSERLKRVKGMSRFHTHLVITPVKTDGILQLSPE
jgi:Lrp/AsnC family transcriptional regulator, leucine-responsive regulatory protein